jgi:hypothetical protein
MKITIENTTKIVELNVASGGRSTIPARIWEGHTESGIPVHCYVTRIAVKDGLDTSQFERELQEMKPPSAELEAIPLRMII